MTTDNSRHRLGLLAVTALSLFGALFARLWVLQIVEGDELSVTAEGNATQEVIIPAARGRIFDRNGIPLVDNRESIVVGIDAQAFEELEDDEQDDLLVRLVDALNVPPEVLPEIVDDTTTTTTTVPDDGSGTTTTSTITTTTLPEVEAPPEPATTYTVEDVRKKLNDSRYSQFRPIPIAEDIAEDQLIYFSEQAEQFPTVVVERETVRDYPYGSLAAHVLGYVGSLSDEQWQDLEDENDPDKPYVQTDQIGKAGVEATYEQYLRGTPGRRVYEVDRTGKVVREIGSERTEPIPGDDLYLSIDAKVQYKAEAALAVQLANHFEGGDGREAGAMVVQDHSTGQVRAMASYPTYDPRELVGGIPCPVWRDLQGLEREGECGDAMTREIRAMRRDGEAPVPKLLNRAIQGDYFPASTFKLASAYAALKQGIRTPETTISDPGFERFCDGEGEGCVKTNAGEQGYGAVDLAKSLTVSSDVYYYKVGREFWEQREQFGETAFQDAVAELGYGAETGIDLSGEGQGQIPTPEREMELAMALFESNPENYDNDIDVAKDAGRWRTGFSADIAIGQKMTATPLQISNAYSALANGGTLWVPSVLDKVTVTGRPDDIVKSHVPTPIRTIDFGAAREDLIWGFRGVVDPTGQTWGGTATSTFQGFPFGSMPLAGKTGTAQTGEDPETKIARPDNALFVGFTTGGSSSWTAMAMLEYSGSGGRAAAPAVRLVLEPIADGTLASFEIPEGGVLDLEATEAAAAGIAAGAAD